MQRAKASSAAICARLGGALGWLPRPPAGSRCRQTGMAARKAGVFEFRLALNCRGALGSGKSGTPCVRMQPANLTISYSICCTWARVGGSWDVDELDEFEPHPASTAAAAIAARAAEEDLDMTEW